MFADTPLGGLLWVGLLPSVPTGKETEGSTPARAFEEGQHVMATTSRNNKDIRDVGFCLEGGHGNPRDDGIQLR